MKSEAMSTAYGGNMYSKLMDHILKEGDSSVYPQFEGCTHKLEWMVVTC